MTQKTDQEQVTSLYFEPTEAQLVYDAASFTVPNQMGKPRKNQLQGTAAERLIELAGRGCYDSLGSGRSSVEYHKHIAEVGHRSVWEHYTSTAIVSIGRSPASVFPWLLNRPGLFVNPSGVGVNDTYRLTFNLRTIVEWGRWSYSRSGDTLGIALQHAVRPQAPQIVIPDDATMPLGFHVQFIQPGTADERHVSLWIKSSRGWSHEMVRHRPDAISQRSTRYVDESAAAWILHPHLVDTYKEDDETRETIDSFIASSRELYDSLVSKVQARLTAAGVDRLTARKQARGAARGYLGNALTTQMIFTASVRQWWCILSQRRHPAADAEMQEAAEVMLTELRASRYAAMFTDKQLEEEYTRIRDCRPYNGRYV